MVRSIRKPTNLVAAPLRYENLGCSTRLRGNLSANTTHPCQSAILRAVIGRSGVNFPWGLLAGMTVRFEPTDVRREKYGGSDVERQYEAVLREIGVIDSRKRPGLASRSYGSRGSMKSQRQADRA